MHHMKAVLWIGVVLAFASCATQQKMESTPSAPTLLGMVYDHDNRPVADVEISIAGTIRVRTDINGRFAIPEFEFGTYELVFHKTNHEDVHISLNYSDATFVLYVKMISAEQVLAEAEAELGQRHWSSARSCIDRALRLIPDDPSARYLDAVLTFRMGDTARAVTILQALLSGGYNEPYVHLFLADLYQYQLQKPQDAFTHLKAYLSLRYDPDIERRCADIELVLTKSNDDTQN